jgi:hypothetical protein
MVGRLSALRIRDNASDASIPANAMKVTAKGINLPASVLSIAG